MTETTKTLNGDLHKEQAILYKGCVKQIARALIKKIPREVLIEVLKSEKIIEQDWSKNGNKYNLRKQI